ncbi:hypothetical protein H7H73_12550 [Mycobacterium rufum]|uniref:Uncharacterized protein n=1 Tax=Mycolicibacterium rufum TaxID=318424 RepID=A0A9X2YCW4_9MYCO|nr:hypothetical protein [Mycolicibacterium rufum]
MFPRWRSLPVAIRHHRRLPGWPATRVAARVRTLALPAAVVVAVGVVAALLHRAIAVGGIRP